MYYYLTLTLVIFLCEPEPEHEHEHCSPGKVFEGVRAGLWDGNGKGYEVIIITLWCVRERERQEARDKRRGTGRAWMEPLTGPLFWLLPCTASSLALCLPRLFLSIYFFISVALLLGIHLFDVICNFYFCYNSVCVCVYWHIFRQICVLFHCSKSSNLIKDHAAEDVNAAIII